jgi:AcrR family transcriptional regulator
VTGRTKRAGLSVTRIVDCAVEILDGGADPTTAEIARRLGVSQPTIYSHVRGLDEIRSLTAIRGMQELSRRVRSAVEGIEGNDAVRAMAFSYRDFVREHPALYMLQQRAPATDEYWSEAILAAGAVRDVLLRSGVPAARVTDAHLVFRAWIHGLVDLEANDALRDVEGHTEEAFELFLEILGDGLAKLA